MDEDRILTALERIDARLETLEAGQARLEAGQTRTDARLERLEDGQTRADARIERLDAGQTSLRVDLMARMDRLENSLNDIRNDIGVNMGAVDAVKRVHNNTREELRALGDQVSALFRKIQRLETRVRELAGDPWEVAGRADYCDIATLWACQGAGFAQVSFKRMNGLG